MRLHSVLAFLAVLAWLPAVQAGNQIYKWTDEEGVAHYTDFPPEGREYEARTVRGTPREAASKDDATESPPPSAALTPANCEIARKNLETFANSPRVSMDLDGDGKAEILTEAQRSEQLANTEALVKRACKGQP